jgi:hypothetical protein
MFAKNTNLLRYIIPILFAFAVSSQAWAQDFAVKTNVLGDAMGSLNIGIEGRLTERWTMDLTGHLDPWTRKDGALRRHAFLQPEARWWFCDSFSGHFLGVHAHGGIFNVGGIDTDTKFLNNDFSILRDSRCQGWFAGAGVAYGYDLIIGSHWNLEFEIGAGYAYTRYDQFECNVCGSTLSDDLTHHYFGITKAAISLVFLF